MTFALPVEHPEQLENHDFALKGKKILMFVFQAVFALGYVILSPHSSLARGVG